MRLLLKVMRWEVPSRHSAGVLPLKRGPEADRLSYYHHQGRQYMVGARYKF